ncbi:MAG: GNAT family N-acetyltransferase [Chloroflexi bacterium]|nr:GNAT family N-acetyltransferase [Chloroflexota bacterium]
MNASAFTGKRIRLAVFDPERDSEKMARWNQNSQYQQLLDSGPSNLFTPAQIKEWIEKHYDEIYNFSIRLLDDDRMVGIVDLSGFDWTAGNAWVGIGIGEPDLWGKGYGTEAMHLILRFAFEELNLKRVSLTVFEYNERAYQSYKKTGFREEGRLRQWLQRGGERYDLIFMGVLRDEWEECYRRYLMEQT